MQLGLPLYECSVCGNAVKVIPMGEGIEPEKRFSCSHTDAIVYANRRCIARGVGRMSFTQEMTYTFRVKVSQLLSWLTGRSM